MCLGFIVISNFMAGHILKINQMTSEMLRGSVHMGFIIEINQGTTFSRIKGSAITCPFG